MFNGLKEQRMRLANLDNMLSSANYENEGQIKLSKREQEILYLLHLYKSPAEISEILTVIHNKNISTASVLSIISKQLYVKFGVKGINKLMQRALMECLIVLPESFKSFGIE